MANPSGRRPFSGPARSRGVCRRAGFAAIVAVAGLVRCSPGAPAAETPALPGPGRLRNVAIVLFDGVELLDFAGPGEVFKSAASIAGGAGGPALKVYTVSAAAGQIVSQGFVTIVPQFTIADSPRPDVVVIPGGDVEPLLRSPEFMRWLRTDAASAEVIMSVCTGAFVLAEAGLLDGLEATTYHGAIEALRASTPRARIRGDRRLIDNGRIVTTAGVSAGIDGALHVIVRLLGRETAERTARYMEYRWTPES